MEKLLVYTAYLLISATIGFAYLGIQSCIRDSDHAIVNAWAQRDSTNAAFVYSSSAGIVIVKGDTVIVSGDFSVSYNGREIPK